MEKILNKKTIAFTLAEVLITLAVIGVVAAISIPSLQNAINDQQYKTAYKKAFAVASQAWASALGDNLISPRTLFSGGADKRTNFLAFKSKFLISKDCSSANNSDCWSSGSNDEKFYISYPTSSQISFIDSSGMAWSEGDGGEQVILLDTNGFKAPNQYGKDRFILGAYVTNINIDKLDTIPSNDIPGLPAIFIPVPDFTNYNANACQHPPCNYTSWLK